MTSMALLVSDIHLSHRPPLARSSEDSWYESMKRQLIWLGQQGRKYKVPILCAGDVFDKWNSPPELINFAIKYLPVMWAIPGQHDLPHHSLDHIKRSAYWTLVEAGKIIHCNGYRHIEGDLDVVGFPWGIDLSMKVEKPEKPLIALVHKYVWKKGFSYSGAPSEDSITNLKKFIQQFDAVAIGDNHKGFIYRNAINCGTFFRRRSDERDYQPQVGLLTDRGIESIPVPCSHDSFLEQKEESRIFEAGELISSLREVQEHRHDLREAARRFMDNSEVKEEVRSLVMEMLGD